jgi:hypothetical protein
MKESIGKSSLENVFDSVRSKILEVKEESKANIDFFKPLDEERSSESPKGSNKSGPMSIGSDSIKVDSPKAASGLFAPKISKDSVFGDGKIERIGQILQRLQS